jgi:carbonic anhydrase
VIRLAHYPLMAKEGVEAIGILACWRCGAVKAAIEYSEEGKQRWHSL